MPESHVSAAFRQQFAALPETVQAQARRAYARWQDDPHHPSLQFKRVSQRQPIWSVRVGLHYRALALWDDDAAVWWFWIGPHGAYDALIKRLG